MPNPNNVVRLHRVLTAPPERVYRAFVEPEAQAKWFPPNGYICKVLQLDFRVGGSFKSSFTNFSTGRSHTFGGKYIEIKPNERIKYTEQFEDPNLPGEMQTTITLRKVSNGTELQIVSEGIPDAIPVEMCYVGWQQSLNQLAQLVEPNITDDI